MPNKTKIMNHYAGPDYVFSVAEKQKVPASWTRYKRTGISGEDFANRPEKFRPGTRYVRLCLSLNSGQTVSEEIAFDQLRFRPVP